MNLATISYLLEQNINANQIAYIKMQKPMLCYGSAITDVCNKQHIITYALYLYLIEQKSSQKQKRIKVVKLLLKMDGNLRKYALNNTNTIITIMNGGSYHNWRSHPFIYQEISMKSALIEMGIDPQTLGEHKQANETSICCFQ